MKMLVTAMRQAARSVEVAECAVRWRDAGVVGFDIAGPEAGYRPTRHLDAFEYVRRENFHITIHAGESFGLPSIWEALQWCGAERLGHGVRIVDDITVRDDGSVELGRLAAFVRDRRVPLEMCPTSNVHTAAAASIAEHPIDLLRRLRFRVTVNTDNRLMSGVTMSSEFAALDEAFGIGLGEMEWLTINALKSAFAPFDERLRLINEVVKPGYARLRAEESRVVAGPPERVVASRLARPSAIRATDRRGRARRTPSTRTALGGADGRRCRRSRYVPARAVAGAAVAMMEIAMGGRVASIVAVARRDREHVPEHGGGVIGAASMRPSERTAKRFRTVAADSRSRPRAPTDFPLPEPGEVRFQARIGGDALQRCGNGVRAARRVAHPHCRCTAEARSVDPTSATSRAIPRRLTGTGSSNAGRRLAALGRPRGSMSTAGAEPIPADRDPDDAHDRTR